MIIISLIILNATSGGLFMYGLLIVGFILIIYGLTGKRTFKCMNCERDFETKDAQQGYIITCPYCSEKYILKENSIYNVKKLEETLSEKEKRTCPDCRGILKINIIEDKWYCPDCNYIRTNESEEEENEE